MLGVMDFPIILLDQRQDFCPGYFMHFDAEVDEDEEGYCSDIEINDSTQS